jgi:hypothetical protein
MVALADWWISPQLPPKWGTFHRIGLGEKNLDSYWTGRMITEWNTSRPGTNQNFALIGLKVGISVPVSGEFVWNYNSGLNRNIYLPVI